MDINISRLKETVILKNTTMESLAYDMGVDRSTLYRKLKKGSSGITLRDAMNIAKSLNLSEAETDSIFGGYHVPRV